MKWIGESSLIYQEIDRVRRFHSPHVSFLRQCSPWKTGHPLYNMVFTVPLYAGNLAARESDKLREPARLQALMNACLTLQVIP